MAGCTGAWRHIASGAGPMNWIVAVGAGAGLGLAYFGGLWLTVRGVLRRPSAPVLVPYGGVDPARAAWGAGLTMLSRNGAGALVGRSGRPLAIAVVSCCADWEGARMEGSGLSPPPSVSHRADRRHADGRRYADRLGSADRRGRAGAARAGPASVRLAGGGRTASSSTSKT